MTSDAALKAHQADVAAAAVTSAADASAVKASVVAYQSTIVQHLLDYQQLAATSF